MNEIEKEKSKASEIALNGYAIKQIPKLKEIVGVDDKTPEQKNKLLNDFIMAIYNEGFDDGCETDAHDDDYDHEPMYNEGYD